MFVRRLGDIFQTETRDNGFYAVRSTLILSAADPEGLNLLDLLRHFPGRDVRLDVDRALTTTSELSNLLKKRGEIVAEIQQESTAAAVRSPIDFAQKPDLSVPGSLRWREETFVLTDQSRKLPEGRNRQLPVAFYLPQAELNHPPFPVVVISHGVAENRTTFAYLAQHLASYGFAVAVIEHPGTSTQKFQQYFAGLGKPPQPTEFVDRALDVKFLLDEFQHRTQSDPTLKGRLDLQQVGVIGHSLGGYTALTLAGATLDFERLRQTCQNNQSLDISVILRCRATDVVQPTAVIRDDQVKAVIAVSPLTNPIFGQRGISQIQVPVMMVAGSEDFVTPAVPEQIRPFTWLKTPDKYLALIEHGTHFSTQADENPTGLPVLPGSVGATSETARSYLRALSVAFLQTHLSHRSEYRPYLSPAYARFISRAAMNLSLVQSLTGPQLVQLLKEADSITIPSSRLHSH